MAPHPQPWEQATVGVSEAFDAARVGLLHLPPLAASLSSSRATISHCRSGCCCFICTPTAQTAGMRWCLSPLLEAVSPHRQGSEQVWRTTPPCFTSTVCINCRLLPLTVRLQEPACSRSSGSSSDLAVVRPTRAVPERRGSGSSRVVGECGEFDKKNLEKFES